MSATQDWTRQQVTGDPVSKLVLRTIGDFANWESGSCFPSIEKLAECCEAHPSTVRRHLRYLEENGFITLQKRDGSSYLITLVGYADWYKTLPVKKSKGATSVVGVSVGEGYLPDRGGVPVREGGATSVLPEHFNLTSNLTNSFDKKIDSSATQEEESRVWIKDGQIKLCDQLNQFWLKEFLGDQDSLNLGLLQIAAYVQPNSVHGLEKQVSSQLARICRDRREKDQRYKNAANPKQAPSKTNNDRGWVKITKGSEEFDAWVTYAKQKQELSIATVFNKCGYAFVPNVDPRTAWEEFITTWRVNDDQRRTQQTRATTSAA